MYEDGIGMARAFEREFNGEVDTVTGPRSGFFAAVDASAADASLPPNPAAYTGLQRPRVAAFPQLFANPARNRRVLPTVRRM